MVTPKQVLVVDDEQAVREVVALALDYEGYAVVTAPHGKVALAVLRQTRPDVVLLDMRMPVMDGWGVARRVRERELAIAIVVMTAARDARVWAREIGADAFLAKPFHLDDLLAAVTRFAGRPS